ncbi:MAG: ABC transporter substrate-binding protein [Alphaproteobacteria bacterium]
MKRLLLSMLAASTLAAAPAMAQAPGRTLTIAFGDPVSSMDPQLNNHAGDRSVDLHFFDLLVENRWNKLQPGLAESWRNLDDTTWEFKLRRGVKWHDGKEFTADDVLFSYKRAPNVPGSVATFAGYLRTIASVEAPDPYTLRIKTKAPNPNLPLNLASVHIVSRHAGDGATTEDYNSGKAMVGTGPFRFVSYTPGDRVIMRRNDDYWGDKPIWSNVNYRYVANPTARTAALLAGDVDVIDKVSVADAGRLKTAANVTLFNHPGLRVLIFQPSFAKGPNKYATDAQGKPLPENPLLDRRVREALSVAINRQAIVDRVMQGTAVAAGQWMPEGTFGYNPAVKMPAFDTEKAKKLLAEAGFPNGFHLTIHLPIDRYIGAPETAQAVAQMWTRAGVRTAVETLPWAVYSSRVHKEEFAMTMIGWGNGTGEGSYALVNILGSVDAKQGRGASNWGHYANPEVDKALDDATAAFDDARREEILRRSVQVVADDVGIIPLFHYNNIWAARKGLTVTPMTSDRTAAVMVTIDKQ